MRRGQSLDPALIGHVTKDQDGAPHLAAVVNHRRRAVVDRRLCALSGDQQRVAGQANHSPLAERALGGALCGEACLLVDDAEYPGTLLAEGAGAIPSGEVLRHRVQEGHRPVRVRCDDGVTDATQYRRQPALPIPDLALGPVSEEGGLDGDAQLAFLERLQDIGVRFGDLRAREGGIVRIGGKKNDGDVPTAADLLRGLDAIHRAAEHDIHEHQVRLGLGRAGDGGLSGGGGAADLVAHARKPLRQVSGNDVLVFDDQDAAFRHGRGSPCGRRAP